MANYPEEITTFLAESICGGTKLMHCIYHVTNKIYCNNKMCSHSLQSSLPVVSHLSKNSQSCSERALRNKGFIINRHCLV